MRSGIAAVATLAATQIFAPGAQAKITAIKIDQAAPFAEGAAFGAVGAYDPRPLYR